MPGPLFDFAWHRPATPEGCELLDTEVEGQPRVFLRPAAGAEFRAYLPLKEETSLFHIFADLERTPAACLRFAQQYGFLVSSRFYRGADAPPRPENIEEEWFPKIAWLRHLIDLWDMVQRKDKKGLSRFVQWGAREVVFANLPPEGVRLSFYGKCTYGGEHDPRRDRITIPLGGETNLDLQEVFARGETIRPALAFLQIAVNAELEGQTSPRLAWGDDRKGLHLQIIPDSLWTALVLQFAHAIDGNRDHDRCPICGTYFERLPGVNRADKVACSARCRVALSRQRRKQAREMSAAGKKDKQIAKEMGFSVPKIREWITGKKG